MNNLCTAYILTGQSSKAVPLLEEAHEKMRATLGVHHTTTLAVLKNLADALQNTRQLGKAVPVFEEALTSAKAKYGADDYETTCCMKNLAMAYLAERQYAKAVPLFEHALEKFKTKFGPDNRMTLEIMGNLASAYRGNNQLVKALPLFEQTLAKSKVEFGPNNIETLVAMNNLAGAYRQKGEFEKAVSLYEQALDKMKVHLKRDHSETLITMNNLGVAYLVNGQPTRAVPLLEQALKLISDKHGPESVETLTTLGNLGDAYSRARQGEKAAATLATYVRGMRKRTPKDSPQFVTTLSRASTDLIVCEQYAAAEPFLREMLAIREKLHPDGWMTFETQSMLGKALLGQKKYADAEAMLLKGYEGMKAREKTIPSQFSERIPAALEHLVQLFEATNKKEDAAKWRQVLTTARRDVLFDSVHEIGKALELRGKLDRQTMTLIYQVKLSAGKAYVIDMVSPAPEALDPYLFLTDTAGKKLAEDDDGGGTLNARIVFRAPQDGVYRIRATSFNAGSGEFVLTVREQAKE